MNVDGEAASRTAMDLVGAVQRFGFLSAASVADRYASLVDRAIAGGGPRAGAPNGGPQSSAWLVDGVVRLTEAYLRLLDSTATLAAATATSRGGEIERVEMPAASPGGISEAALWIHNSGSTAVVDSSVVVTDLSSAVGRIGSDRVHLSPPRAHRIEPGGSRELRVRVDVPHGQQAGSYHGMALVSTAPDEPVALHLRVRQEDPGQW